MIERRKIQGLGSSLYRVVQVSKLACALKPQLQNPAEAIQVCGAVGVAGGVMSSASRLAWIAAPRSANSPIRSNLQASAGPRVFKYAARGGVAGWGDVKRFAAGLDRGLQVGQLPDPFESACQSAAEATQVCSTGGMAGWGDVNCFAAGWIAVSRSAGRALRSNLSSSALARL